MLPDRDPADLPDSFQLDSGIDDQLVESALHGEFSPDHDERWATLPSAVAAEVLAFADEAESSGMDVRSAVLNSASRVHEIYFRKGLLDRVSRAIYVLEQPADNTEPHEESPAA